MNMFNISFLWMEISMVGGGSFYFIFYFFYVAHHLVELDLFFFRAADATEVFEPPADVERKEQRGRVQR